MPNLTTTQHFEIFRKEARKWIDWFSLHEWAIGFQHGGTVDPDVYAECWTKAIGRTALLVLGADWGKNKVTKVQVQRSAFHECAELWLRNLNDIAERRTFDENEAEKETHRLIRLLENRVFDNA